MLKGAIGTGTLVHIGSLFRFNRPVPMILKTVKAEYPMYIAKKLAGILCYTK